MGTAAPGAGNIPRSPSFGNVGMEQGHSGMQGYLIDKCKDVEYLNVGIFNGLYRICDRLNIRIFNGLYRRIFNVSGEYVMY